VLSAPFLISIEAGFEASTDDALKLTKKPSSDSRYSLRWPLGGRLTLERIEIPLREVGTFRRGGWRALELSVFNRPAQGGAYVDSMAAWGRHPGAGARHGGWRTRPF
jgi:hypothetical protein